jgi:hypothetical protein
MGAVRPGFAGSPFAVAVDAVGVGERGVLRGIVEKEWG